MSLLQHILCLWFHFAVPVIAEGCPRWFHAPLERGAKMPLERWQIRILHTRTYTSAPSTVPPPASVSNINNNITRYQATPYTCTFIYQFSLYLTSNLTNPLHMKFPLALFSQFLPVRVYDCIPFLPVRVCNLLLIWSIFTCQGPWLRVCILHVTGSIFTCRGFPRPLAAVQLTLIWSLQSHMTIVRPLIGWTL